MLISGCTSNKTTTKAVKSDEVVEVYNIPRNAIKNVFIIDLASTEDMILWIDKYQKMNASIKRMISRNPNLWTIEYDTTLIKPLDFYSILKKDTTIINFEFDKNLQLR